MSVQSYPTALIWVCPQTTLIFFYQSFTSILATWLAIWFSVESGYSSPLCGRSLATLPTSRFRLSFNLLLFDSYRLISVSERARWTRFCFSVEISDFFASFRRVFFFVVSVILWLCTFLGVLYIASNCVHSHCFVLLLWFVSVFAYLLQLTCYFFVCLCAHLFIYSNFDIYLLFPHGPATQRN